eukprot:26714_1
MASCVYTIHMFIIFVYIKLASSLSCSSYDYVNKIRNILSKQTDYKVYEGKLIFRQNASFEYGTNPSGIYGGPYFENLNNITNPNSPSPHGTYFFRSSNALIFAGCTPPKSKYFSFVSYTMYRFNEATEKRQCLWASLGAALNNLVWNTSNNISNNYDSLTTVISTGDNQTYTNIYNMLTTDGISNNEINLQSLPNKYIEWLPYKRDYKYNNTYDTGSFLLRVTLTDNHTEYEQYIHTNQTIFILEPKYGGSDVPKQPFEPFVRNTYSTNNINETALYSDMLNEYKIDLINYLEITYNLSYKRSIIFPNIVISEYNVSDLNLTNYGFGCIEENRCCGGDNRDAQYWEISTDYNISLNIYNNNKFYIILGLMHSNYNIQQTVYSNFVYADAATPNKNEKKNPVITNFEYNGSGLILPVETNINEKYLQNVFVVQLTEPNLCINQLPGFCYIPNTINFGNVVYRNYLNPITKTRPDMTEIVTPILIVFEKSL